MCVENELRTMTVLEYRAFNFHTRCLRTVDRQEGGAEPFSVSDKIDYLLRLPAGWNANAATKTNIE